MQQKYLGCFLIAGKKEKVKKITFILLSEQFIHLHFCLQSAHRITFLTDLLKVWHLLKLSSEDEHQQWVCCSVKFHLSKQPIGT